MKFVKNPAKVIYVLDKIKISRLIPDRAYLMWKYKAEFGKKLNLDNPQTYNEKLQWLKLYDRKPEYTKLVDKCAVREYVADKIGKEYLVPLLGQWDDPEDIKLDALPEQFALKCNHDSGSVIICRSKSDFDLEKAKEKLKSCLRHGTYYYGREWPYKNVKPCIIAEEYLEDAQTSELRDYKFFAFNGVAKAMFIATDRQNQSRPTAFDFFDENCQHMDMRHGHPNAPVVPEKPHNFERMKALAEKLAVGLPQVRVDFYEVNGQIYFGEMTFFHHCGFVPFDPEEWDYIFGQWIQLPKN